MTINSGQQLSYTYLCYAPRAVQSTTMLKSFGESKVEQIGFPGPHSIYACRRTATSSLGMGRVGLCLDLHPGSGLLDWLCSLPHNLHHYSSPTEAIVRPKSQNISLNHTLGPLHKCSVAHESCLTLYP